MRSYLSKGMLREGIKALAITSKIHQTELIITVLDDLWKFYWAVLMSLLHFAAIL
jgi:hypothetical protein